MNKTEATKMYTAALAFAVGSTERDKALLACSKLRIRDSGGPRHPSRKPTGAAAAKRAAVKRNNIRKRG
jgi:hypothetical protein